MGVDPAALCAQRPALTWVSLRDDMGDTSFDIVAQARAWGDFAPYLPAYIGDTTAGLWLAFKALAARPGHHVVLQATALAKLVEGELCVEPPEARRADRVPWDADVYEFDALQRRAIVEFKGRRIVEPARDAAWRRANLRHVGGRFVI